MKILLINTCLVCDKEIPFGNKMFCSFKCLRETKKQCEEQNGKGTCGYDKSDVYIKRTTK